MTAGARSMVRVCRAGVAALLLLLGACASLETHALQRSAELRLLYPPGATARADVQSRFGPITPNLSATRPGAGWADARPRVVGLRALESERRTGKSPSRVERYLAPDGLFSLCYCWFYYDDGDRVVDVEWQYASD